MTADCNDRHSPTSSIISNLSSASSNRTQRNKKKREASPESSNAKIHFWKTASQALMNISTDDNAQDGIRHWILYLETELRKKDKKRLKRLQRKIIELVDDEDSA